MGSLPTGISGEGVARSPDDRIGAFDMSRCPDCDYGLTGVPPAIPIDRAGLNTGPRACPECGCDYTQLRTQALTALKRRR